MQFRYKYLIANIIVLMIVFSLSRLDLFITYDGYFSQLTTNELMLAFADGLRFDLSTIAAVFAIPFLLMTLPINKKNWLKIIAIFTSIVLVLTLLLLVGDILYFDVVKRHLGEDFFVALSDMGFIFNFAVKQYWYLLIVIAIGFIVYIKFQFKIINKYFDFKKNKLWFEILYHIIYVLLIIILIRGGFGQKPINIINAYSIPNSEYGNLVLNGVFCCVKTGSSDKVNHHFFNDSLAISKTLQCLLDDNEIIPDNDYPLCRERLSFIADSLKSRKFNVVVFLLESWTPEYIDSYGHNHYGVTPNFDSLAAKGLKFTNAYANGDRSIYGITATLLGIPQPKGMHYLGRGLELNKLFRIGNIFDKEGYATVFSQTSKRGSFRLNVIAKALGFQEYYGKEDYKILYHYQSKSEPFFGWDYEALMFLEKRLSQIKTPFFAYLFTGTTHEAYVLPDKRFEKYPHQSNGLNGFLNTLNYSDWSFGKFFEKARKEDWFKKTIFIFSADHTSKFVANKIKARFHIPILIYCPALFKGKEIKRLVAQTDIVPTIFDILGFKYPYMGTGRSMFSKNHKQFVVGRKGSNLMILDTNAALLFNYKKIVMSEVYTQNIDSLSYLNHLNNKLKYIDQVLFMTSQRNKYYPE